MGGHQPSKGWSPTIQKLPEQKELYYIHGILNLDLTNKIKTR